jgi:hypothetical protein
MKKVLFSILLLLSTNTFAQHYGHHGHWRHGYNGYNGWNWVVPAVVGGIVVYEVSKNQPPPAPQQSVIIQQNVIQPNCSPWTETISPDGQITRTRTCTQLKD